MTMTLSGDGTITGLVAGGLPDATITSDDLAAGAALNSVSDGVFFRNRIINGDMRIDQRNNGAAVTTSGAFPVDRFLVPNNTDGAYSAQQDSSAPAGFVNSVKITTTTEDATLTTTQNIHFQHRIEGTNVADFGFGTAAAKTVTLSFWVRSSLTGTFGGALRNSGSNRSYPFTYAISVVDTWEYKTVTIPGDTTGTWLTDTGTGVLVAFGLGAGPDRSGTADAWNSNNNFSATGAVSVIGTLNATWYITGVQLEVGSVATPFERRPFGTELMLCQRYCYVARDQGSTPFVAGAAASTTQLFLTYNLPVTPRATPTLSFSGVIVVSDQFATDPSASPPTVLTAPINSTTNGRVQLGGFSGLIVGRFYGGAPNLSGITTFNMEL